MNVNQLEQELGGGASPSPPTTQTSQFANLLRALGGAALVLSGVIFMFQGFEHIAQEMRTWLYLLVVAALAATAVAARSWLEDAKGARLLFGLAAAALVAQVAQLAGMIHELGVADLAQVNAGLTLWIGVLTMALFAPLSFTAFSVLARPWARSATFLFAISNVLLLLPVREGIGAFVVLAALFALCVAFERYVARGFGGVRTIEVQSMRLLMVLPLLFASVRTGLYLDDLLGVCALFGVVSVLLAASAKIWMRDGGVAQTITHFAALGIAMCAWSVATLFELQLQSGMVKQNLLLLPLIGMLLGAGHLSAHLGRLYRFLAAVLMLMLACASLIAAQSGLQTLWIVLLGAGFSALGVVRQQRETTFAGVAVVAIASVYLGWQAVAQIDTNYYLVLAILGIGLVFSASALERFGRRAALALSHGLQEVVHWR